MSTIRKIVFQTEYYYHVFNRGLDKRIIFENKWEYNRAMQLLKYYQYQHIPIRYSLYKEKHPQIQESYWNAIVDSGKKVEIISYCLMPNHFHLLLKQKTEEGITTYISEFVNAYTKYYNTKHNRVGRLFQGSFKSVFVDTDDQLLHEIRYIHLNPVVASIVHESNLETYMWSSHNAYKNKHGDEYIEQQRIATILSLIPDYEDFIYDQVSYGKELALLKKAKIE